MGRRKKIINEDEIVRKIRSLIEAPETRDKPLSGEALAKALKIRKKRLLEILQRAGISLQGQSVRARHLEDRVNQLPIAELIGLHVQRVVKMEVRDGKTILLPQRVAAVAFILPEHSKNFSGRDLKSARDNALCPSFLASDKMRITDFECVLAGLLDTLDDPHNPNIDFPKFTDALRSFAEFRKHGCHIHVFAQFEGCTALGLEELKSWAAGATVHIWNHPLVELLAPITSIDIVSFAGPGFFPLLGATNRRLRDALAGPFPRKSISISWTEDELHAVLQSRLRICDALAEEGLLYGVPQTKVGEMAEKAEATISRNLAGKDLNYGDGLNDWEDERPINYVTLGVPARLNSKYLMQLPMDVLHEKPFIGLRVVEMEGGKVECLVAWLPQLREMLLRALRTPGFNEMHSRWVAAQERAIAKHDLETFRDCVEIINPEGSMQVGNLSIPLPDDVAAELSVASNMAVGMLLGAYDADSLVGRLISLRDWRKCGELQQKWTGLLLAEILKNNEKIISLAKWDSRQMAQDVLLDHIEKMNISGNRLIRFVIEQAAVNFSQDLLETSRSMGFSGSGWPDEEKVSPGVFELMARKLEGWWPVVGIRLDYLIAGLGYLVRRHVRTASEREKIMNMLELDWHNTFVAQPLPAKKKPAAGSDNLTYNEPCDYEHYIVQNILPAGEMPPDQTKDGSTNAA